VPFVRSKPSIRSQLSLSRIPTKDLNNLAEDVETVRQNESVLVRMAMHPWFERITMAVIFLNAVWKLGAKRRLELPTGGLKRSEKHKRIKGLQRWLSRRNPHRISQDGLQSNKVLFFF